MRKSLFLIFALCSFPVLAAQRITPDRFINKSLYENIYPSTLNNTQNGQTPITQATKITTPAKRNVAKRPLKSRAATATQPQTTKTNSRNVVPRNNKARATTNTNRTQPNRSVSNRRVVARSAKKTSPIRTSRQNRSATTSTNYATTGAVSSKRCFADYKTCMDSYCERSNTAYNRCYCNAKLAQIDAKYQNKTDSLIQEIIRLKYNTDATDAEIKEYWDSTVGVYTKTNPWVNIDKALDIDWADMDSRVRGQNAFAAGHTYCVNHLRACSSMATNLRDAYRSETERDCANYEKTLERIQMAAESVIESYNE